MEKGKGVNVTGKWTNELGSVMTLKENKKHQISGTYKNEAEFKLSNKKESDGPGEIADLVGYTNTHLNKDKILTTTITFCMAWKDEGSCSAFSGQIFQDDKGADVMKTTWLLHSPVESQTHNWEATRVGENTFHRIKE
ncbi:hypothetical protein R3I94_008765 [Phoxinus phoxinus]